MISEHSSHNMTKHISINQESIVYCQKSIILDFISVIKKKNGKFSFKINE